MNLLPEQRDLALIVVATALMWLPYTLALIARGGLTAAMGNRVAVPELPAWSERAKRAHANAVENLVLFAPLVLIGTVVVPGAPMIAAAARVYLVARLVHYAVYVAGIPVIRTIAFFVAWGATLAIAWSLFV